MRTVIIGGGVGGLATAIRLSSAGHRVTVLERNATVGGRANELRADGYRFDTGPSLLLMPDVYRELFASAGRRVEDYVDLIPMEPNYRVHFANGEWYEASRDIERMAGQLGQTDALDSVWRWRAWFREPEGAPPEHAVTPAFLDTVRRYDIPLHCFVELIDGLQGEVENRR